MWEVWPSLTNRPLRPVTGWMRTTGAAMSGTLGELLRRRRVLLHGADAAAHVVLLRGIVLDPVFAVAVHVFQPLQALLHGFRQRIVSGGAAGEVGVAQRLAVPDGNPDRIQRRQQARLALVGQVAVPEAAGILRADRLAAVVEHVRQDEDFRVVGQPRFLAHVMLEHAEAAGEGDLLFRREFLVAEEHDLVVEEGRGDLGESIVVERLRQIDAADFRAQVFADFSYDEHECFSLVLDGRRDTASGTCPDMRIIEGRVAGCQRARDVRAKSG